MKVCILTSSFPAHLGDNQSPFVYRFAKSLVDNKVDVEVVCPYYKSSKSKYEIMEGIKVSRFKYFFRRFQTFTEVGSIPDAIKSFYGKIQLPFFCFFYLFGAFRHGKKADIVHAQWMLPSGFIGLFFKKFFGKPLIVTTRGSEVLLATKNIFWRFFFMYSAKNCDYITSNNIRHLEVFRSLGINSSKLGYIPNGLDYDIFKRRNKKQARSKLGLNFDEKIILYVGHLVSVKRVDRLINSFNYLSKKYKKMKLLIVGGGYLKDNITSLVDGFSLNDKVIFIGSVSPQDVAIYFNAADVFVLCSESEGRPNVVLEAMASGLPVVTTDVGDLKSFVVGGRDCFIVNENELTDKIGMLLSNSRLRNKFSKNGLTAVKKSNPGWREATTKYVKLYSTLLEK